MSKHSRKGFKKLENHELSEFTTLQDEESGSDSEMMEPDHGNVSSRRGGGVCCWCVALYLLLLTCFVVLMGMVAVYFGYNVMHLSSDYKQRIRSLEDKIQELEKSLNSAETKSTSLIEQLGKELTGVNGSVIQLASNLQTHSSTVEGSVKGVKERVNDLRDRVEAFKSHPPAIGKKELTEIRSRMAEFHSHLESYDSQLKTVKQLAGDATLDVSVVDKRVLLLRRNVSSLKGSLNSMQLDHKDTENSLDLLAIQFSALQVVVKDMNETLLQEVDSRSGAMNETKVELEGVKDRLTVLTEQLETLEASVEQLNTSLDLLAGSLPVTNSPAVTTETTTVTTESTTAPQTTQPVTMPSTEPQTEPRVTTESTTAPQTTQPVTMPSTEPQTEPRESTTAPQTTQPVTMPSTEPQTEPRVTTESTTAPQTTQPVTVPSTEPQTEPHVTEATAEPTIINRPNEPVEIENEPEKESTTEIVTVPSEDSTTESSSTTVSNQPSNEEGQAPSSTSPSIQPSSDGIHAVTDSTGATEDLPASPSLPSSGQGSPDNNVPEEQPPTVGDQQKGLHETISNLEAMLQNFDVIDTDMSNGLDFSELFLYTGSGDFTRRLFQAMDIDQDNILMKEEIMSTIQALEKQTTEGTEAVPNENNTDSVTGTLAQPEAATNPSAAAPIRYDDEVVNTAPESETAAAPVLNGDLLLDNTDSTGSDAMGTVTEPTAAPANSDGTGDMAGTETVTSGEKSRVVIKMLSAILKNFDVLDINGDKRLNSSEFSAYFPGNDVMASSIFRALDTDGDNFVTNQEIVQSINMLDSVREEEDGWSVEESQNPEEELADYLHNDDDDNTNF